MRKIINWELYQQDYNLAPEEKFKSLKIPNEGGHSTLRLPNSTKVKGILSL